MSEKPDKVGLLEHIYLKYIRPSPDKAKKKVPGYKVPKPVGDKISMIEHIYLKYFRPAPPGDIQRNGCSGVFGAVIGLLGIGRK